ncbi:hypothetical protein UR09_05860 [Candidatus Nitromaritima sp. SCGC AAA799-A02]|nr:hypothetical protein UR09_05860 [Candidatus Nitromaritima sp. SCGC AAA799-A02]KMP11754.1 hypothetical protein UZ36_03235 [Candidatus Nitromaritima sp. SCGC AAA799-C22]
MENDWKEPYEDDGVTLGPEEALRREIEKTKALKVERLKLNDTIEKLRTENEALAQSRRSLEEKIQSLTGGTDADPSGPRIPTAGWAFFLLAFNLAAVGILLFFLLKQ